MTNEQLLANPQFIADLKDQSIPRTAIADRWDIHQSRVARLRRKIDAADGTPTQAKTPPGGLYRFDDDGVTVNMNLRASVVEQSVSDVHQGFRDENLDPDDFDLIIKRSKWENGAVEEDGSLRVLFACGVTAKRIRSADAAESAPIDPVGILAALRAQAPLVVGNLRMDPAGKEGAFCISINDIQLGQGYNGGSEATIAQFYEFVELAKERINNLVKMGYRFTKLVVVCGGDLVEGCVIYANQSYNIDLSRKQQAEGVIALLLHALDTLAPLFPAVEVLASKGNHGEHRIGGKKTSLDDNDDTHVVEMAKLALSRDPNMQHIGWTIAVEEAAVWLDVFGWNLVTTHGDIYAKGVSGATTERKAHAWMKNMAAAFRRFGNVGRADLLVTHHFHHDEMADWGDTLWRQTPSQDRGSPEFTQASGTYSEPGMLTWVMTPKTRYAEEAVLR